MPGNKVYDLAKEFDVQSKDFVAILQEANIPVKNHMSALTEQQEKYFRNNFDVVGGKLVQKSAHEVKEAVKSAAPTAAKPTVQPKTGAAEKPKQPQSSRPQGAGYQGSRDQNSDNSRNNRPQGGGYQGNRQGYQGNRDQNGNYQGNREQGNRQGYQGNRPQGGGYQGNRDQNGNNRPQGSGYQGNRPGYQGNRPQGSGYQGNRPGYQGNRDQNGNNRPQGSGYQGNNYQGNRNQSGTYQPNRPGYQGNRDQNGNNRPQGSGYQGNRPGYQGNRPQGSGYQGSRPPYQGGRPGAPGSQQGKRPGATGEATVEKPKIDKNKKTNKLKNDAKTKARENFYQDENRPRLDNTKRTRGSKADYKKKKLETREVKATSGVTGTVIIPETVSISELSQKILISAADIIKILMSYDIMASVNQVIDFDTAQIICEELNITIQKEVEEDLIEKQLKIHFADDDKLCRRPPIVTVMGHVDHGKTSLLDSIRNTHVISGEAGGITQHIGAYTVQAKDRSVTFIDTPGHEAFTAMRSRGASVTDVAILVIAADDGIKPQTVEAINHAKAAGVPIVVAINKIDKPTANIDKVKQELTEYGLVSEDWGGDTICVPVSAKTGEGIDNLLDMLLLVADVEDLKANYEERAVGTIIEARIDKQRGIAVTVLIKSGTLNVGDFIVTGTIYGKVRAMLDHSGQKITSAGPSIAAEVLGLSEVPSAGDKFFVAENEREAKTVTERKKAKISILATKAAAPLTLDDIFNRISQGELKEINLIVKADVSGSFEAIKQSLEKLNDNDDGIRVNIIHSGVGSVTETDVSLAAASKALIMAFNVKAEPSTKASSEKEGVEIRNYSVIYDLIDDIEAAMKGLKEPEYEEVVTGSAEVRATFKLPSNAVIAGCYITEGAATRKDKVRVIRDGQTIHEGDINSLKHYQEDVKEMAAGFECGIGIEKFNNVKEGDKLEFYIMRKKED